MHFSSIVVPFVAMAAAVQGQSVRVYSDAKCKNLIQTVNFSGSQTFQCANLNNGLSQGVIFPKAGFNKPNVAFGAWDAQYCSGDTAGIPKSLNHCLAAKNFGLQSWRSIHIGPRNPSPPSQGNGGIPIISTLPLPSIGLP